MSLLLTIAEVQMNMLRRGGRCSDEDDLMRLEAALSAHKASQRSVQYPATIWDDMALDDQVRVAQARMQRDADKADNEREWRRIRAIGVKATAKRNAAIVAAHDAGVPILELAEASRITRQRVYQIINRREYWLAEMAE